MVPNSQWIKIKAPATVANMVCGFDILGFAVNDPYDQMEMRWTSRKKEEPSIVIINIDAFQLPTEPEKNVAGVALIAFLEEYDEKVQKGELVSIGKIQFQVKMNKQIKPGSGVGSSAASSAGAVVGANYLLGNIFSKDDLVRFAMHGEKLASGVKHADNIAPCIFGGVTLVRSIFPLEIVTLPSPELFVTIVHPQIEVRTADARSILRQKVLLKDAIKQWGNIAGLIAGLMKSDYALIGRSLEDVIIEPVRSILIPGFDALKLSCKNTGALGGGISGSGPSIFMLSATHEIAMAVEKQMHGFYEDMQLPHHTYVTTINQQGVQVVQ